MQDEYIDHHFNVAIATKYGIDAATFLHNLKFWILKNKANNKHFYDGRYWSYNSINAYTKLFPYWSTKQLRRIIDKLKSENVIVSGNFNSSAYDRTHWYSLTDFGHELLKIDLDNPDINHLSKPTNGVGEKGKPIPYKKPDNKTKDKSFRSSDDDPVTDYSLFEQFWSAYPRKQKKLAAVKIWKKDCLEGKGKIIIEDVEKRKRYDWKGRQKNYIPHPTTYLNGKPWDNDEYIEPSLSKKEQKEHPVTKILRDLQEDFVHLSPEEQQSLIDFMN